MEQMHQRARMNPHKEKADKDKPVKKKREIKKDRDKKEEQLFRKEGE